MSLSGSPQLEPTPTMPTPNGPGPAPRSPSSVPASSLAAMLSDTYQEIESLRRDLGKVQKRAERAERLASSLQSLHQSISHTDSSPKAPQPANPNPSSPGLATSQPETAIRILLEYEERAVQAERLRDEATARLRLLSDTWSQLESYLQLIDARTLDARAGFSRLVSEGGGSTLVFSNIPGLSPPAPPAASTPASSFNFTASVHPPRSRARVQGSIGTPVFPSLPLPPHPGGNSHSSSNTIHPGSRRPRTPSLESYTHIGPSNKKPRVDGERRGRDDRPSMAVDPHLPPQHLHQGQAHGYEYADRQPHRSQSLHQQQSALAHQQPRMILPPGGSSHGHRRRSPSRSPYPHPSHPHGQHPSHPSQQQPQPQQPNHQHHHHHHHHQLPHGQHHAHSRSSSRSSSSSLSVDEMLLQATTGDGPAINGTNTEPAIYTHGGHLTVPPPAPGGRVSRRREREAATDREGRPHPNPDSYGHDPQASAGYVQGGQPMFRTASKSVSSVVGNGNGSAAGAEPLPQPGQAREFQTHIFAPPVTGAPQKKSKYVNLSVGAVGESSQSSAAGGATPAAAAAAYPATNEAGQRICRQCGMPGRYKDGKCVEKWGPGPMGPGSVCDRCRKKMKRVERRGTLENQQLANSNSIAAIQHQQLQQHSPSPHRIQRTDTIPAHQSSQLNFTPTLHRESESNVRGPSTGAFRNSPVPPRSPPPPIISLRDEDNIPTSAIGRGSEAAAARGLGLGSRSNSRNGHTRGNGGRGSRAASEVNGGLGVGVSKKSPLAGVTSNGGKGGGSRTTSKSPREMDGDGDGDADADADAEAEAEIEAEIEGTVDGGREERVKGRKGSGNGSGTEMEVDADADAEADLLEAVDAAEANSISSGGGGRLKEEDV